MLRYSDNVASRRPLPPLSITATTFLRRSLSTLKGAPLSPRRRIDGRLKMRDSARLAPHDTGRPARLLGSIRVHDTCLNPSHRTRGTSTRLHDRDSFIHKKHHSMDTNSEAGVTRGQSSCRSLKTCDKTRSRYVMLLMVRETCLHRTGRLHPVGVLTRGVCPEQQHTMLVSHPVYQLFRPVLRFMTVNVHASESACQQSSTSDCPGTTSSHAR